MSRGAFTVLPGQHSSRLLEHASGSMSTVACNCNLTTTAPHIVTTAHLAVPFAAMCFM